ncbi:non-ribosomal peptide synthetase [Streptomyces lavendofoliae]|uniref:non-ribosomal peptide synthetase n=1 Tax=Streptomyces lavendofoliae TaxID=67314 RepID=UPI003D8C3239
MNRPAGPGQLRFFLLDQRDGRAVVVHRVTVDGPVEADRLTRAVRAVIEGQPALRTSLRPTPEGLMQRVLPASEVPVTVSRIEAGDIRSHVDLMGAPFPHEGEPLCRVTVLLEADRAHCVFGVHHAVFDDDSQAILLRALLSGYENEGAIAPAGPPPAAPTPERTRELEEFWQRTLKDCPDDTTLPQFDAAARTDRTPATVHAELTPELVSGMTERARTWGATPFSQLLAALAWVTGWYARRDDVVLCTVAGGRTAESAEVIGCWQNTLPVRLDLADATTESLLERAVDAVYDAVEHSDLPLEDITALIGAARVEGRHPLTQILCTQSASAEPATDATGLTWTAGLESEGDAEYDLSVALTYDNEGGMRLTAGYPRTALDKRTAEDFLDHLMRALAALTQDRAVPLTDLDLLAPEATPPTAGHEPAPHAAGHRLVHEWVAWHGATTPNAVALVADGGATRLDYATLDRRVRTLAAALIERGVRPGDRVGICLPRTADLLVSVLATWRAGAAYVPLDPEYPAERLRYMIEDSAPVTVITSHALETLVPTLSPAATATGAADGDPAHRQPGAAAALAYVIYTSGTTGRPKGVSIRHDNLHALFAAFDEVWGEVPADLVAATSLSFDISALELYWPLVGGRTVHLTDHRSVAHQPAAPAGALYQCTPTVARMHATSPEGRSLLGRLSGLLVGGEPLPADLAAELVDLVPGPVLNCYGPTETTVWSTVWPVEPGVPVHIGRPLAGEACHVVDAHGRTLPYGSPGMLMVSGAGVGDGYWQQPALTTARFTPLRTDPEVIGYHTGDLVLNDRQRGLRYLGRGDSQVKVLGQRIEPEEIESALRGHPSLRDAAVSVLPDGTGIAAFVVLSEPRLDESVPGDLDGPVEPPADLTAALGAHASAWLTAAMTPAVWRTVRALPQLPNGKLDRSRLTRWTEDMAGAPVTQTPLAVRPATSSGAAAGTVAAVAEAWASVLGHPVTDHDVSFFALGGTSAGVVRVLSLLRGAYPALSTAALFRHTTVRAFAAHLDALHAPAPAADAAGVGDAEPGRGAARARALSAWAPRSRRRG